MRDLLAEATYCLELARPHLPRPVHAPGAMSRSALVARIDMLVDAIYQQMGDSFPDAVRSNGA
jgi:hypothetical protein